MKRPTAIRRGRPRSASEGARDAFDVVESYRAANSLSFNALALRCGMTPSTVSRALSSRAGARWTPALRKLYSIAQNDPAAGKITPVMTRLASYEGPGEAAVKRLLNDVEELIESLSTARR
jgi:transcriptional regulator with XRE-family HTH domain